MQPKLKYIKIGEIIHQRIVEQHIDVSHICDYLNCSEAEINNIIETGKIDVESLLKLSKLLQYDFFRLYSQHLILYAPPARTTEVTAKTNLPSFRKKLYSYEIVEFIIELLRTGKKTKLEIINEYNIPKTTLYKWIKKYGDEEFLSKPNWEIEK